MSEQYRLRLLAQFHACSLPVATWVPSARHPFSHGKRVASTALDSAHGLCYRLKVRTYFENPYRKVGLLAEYNSRMDWPGLATLTLANR